MLTPVLMTLNLIRSDQPARRKHALVVRAPPHARRRCPSHDQLRVLGPPSRPPVPLIGRNDRLAVVGLVPGKVVGHGPASRSGLHRGRRSCPQLLMQAASSSEPPNERGGGVPSSRSLATATHEPT